MGPAVRILFPPAASQRRTALVFWRPDGKLELIVYPPSPTVPGHVASPDLFNPRPCARGDGHAVVLTPKWDQRFESAFLQRRVRCELGPQLQRRRPKGKHDDQVDSTAQFLDWFKKPFPGQGDLRALPPASAG